MPVGRINGDELWRDAGPGKVPACGDPMFEMPAILPARPIAETRQEGDRR